MSDDYLDTLCQIDRMLRRWCETMKVDISQEVGAAFFAGYYGGALQALDSVRDGQADKFEAGINAAVDYGRVTPPEGQMLQ